MGFNLSFKGLNFRLIRSIFSALIRCIQFIGGPTNALRFVNVIVLYSDHRHVSATHVVIFRAVSARLQIYF